jgi:hypothetical protein
VNQVGKTKKFHLFCKGNHWWVSESGQLMLDTPHGKQEELTKRVVDTLDYQIRQTVYAELASFPLTSNRKQIIKHGVENVALSVQKLLAESVMAKFRPVQGSKDAKIKSTTNSDDSINISVDTSSESSESGGTSIKESDTN